MSKQYVYGAVPSVKRDRSKFNESYSHKTAFNVGELIPFYTQEVYPGDTFDISSTCVFRTSSAFLRPVMDNAFLDQYFYFVPYRLLVDNWANMFGDDTPNGWATPEQLILPTVKHDITETNKSRNRFVGTIADYIGIPPEYQALDRLDGDSKIGVNSLVFRAYAKVYNDWFRDENLIDPVLIDTSADGNGSEYYNDKPFAPNNYTGKPAKIAKIHDYFTQALPRPQKGNPVTFASAILEEMSIPVTTANEFLVYDGYPMKLGYVQAGDAIEGFGLGTITPFGLDVAETEQGVRGVHLSNSNLNIGVDEYRSRIGDIGAWEYSPADSPVDGYGKLGSGIAPMNLKADIPQMELGAINVNDLRFAFQLQKMLERDARSGGRYREYIKAAFGVDSGDARLQVSEYLGGGRVPLNIYQVNQTSAQVDNGTPVGTVGAFSLSGGEKRVVKSFTEHGVILGVCAVRYRHTYQQGIEKFLTRRIRTDFYDPVFQSIGEQPVYKYELFANADPEEVFGYNPAWEDLRVRQNRISGAMRSGLDGDRSKSLDVWHFADFYDNAPVLGQQFIEENANGFDRTLSVPSSSLPNFIFDFFFNVTAVRELPIYGVPSLIDHH